jgi:zinc protease
MIAPFALLLSLLQGAAPGDSGLRQYEINGLRVIQQSRATSSHVVAVELYLLGGSRQVTAANAGIEPFYLSASAYGTAKYPGEAARRAQARTGSTITFSVGSDWTTFEFHGLKADFDSTWNVFADRLLQPTLDSASMAIVRALGRSLAGRRNTSPEEQAWYLADSLAFVGHPYGVDPNGTDQSIAAITTEMLRAYAKEHFVTSRMLLVVVGDISRDQVEKAVQRSIGTLPRGSYTWKLPEPWKPGKAQVAVAQRAATTNYLVGYMTGPARNSDAYPAFDRAMRLLGGWISFMVREQSGLSYAAGVSVMERGAPAAAIHISTTDPDSSMKIVNNILKAYESEVTLPRSTLRAGAKSFHTAYTYETETASGQASLLGRAALYDGDPTAASRLGDVMARISFPDLRKIIRLYGKNIQYAFVGDTTRVPRKEMEKR